MPIDTQEVVDQLQQAGVPAQQAKAHAAVLANALDSQAQEIKDHCCSKLDLARAVAPLASKEDLAQAKGELHHGLKEAKAEFQHGLKEVRAEFQHGLTEAKAEFRQGLAGLKDDVNLRLGELRAEFYRALTEHGEKLESRIAANIRGDFIKWGFGIVFAQTGLLALLIQLFDLM